jgi:hypothetical protein
MSTKRIDVYNIIRYVVYYSMFRVYPPGPPAGKFIFKRFRFADTLIGMGFHIVKYLLDLFLNSLVA